MTLVTRPWNSPDKLIHPRLFAPPWGLADRSGRAASGRKDFFAQKRPTIIMANRRKRNARERLARAEEKQWRAILSRDNRDKNGRYWSRHFDRQHRSLQRRLLRKGFPDWFADNYGWADLSRRFASHRHHWLRQPQTLAMAAPEEQYLRRDLVQAWAKHLFARYEVPECLAEVWWGDNRKRHHWYTHVAQGGNLRKVDHLPFPLTNRMVESFLAAPSSLQLEQSLRYAQVCGYGGTEALAQDVAQTFVDFRAERQPFYRELIQWLVANPPAHSEELAVIYRYVNAQKFDLTAQRNHRGLPRYQPPPAPEFRMKGRCYDRLLQHAKAWEEEQQLTTQLLEEENILSEVGEYAETAPEDQSTRYEIRLLRSEGELKAEGRALNHCVYSYATQVAAGGTSIWSLRKTTPTKPNQRVLTIEVTRHLRVEELRGKNNRWPKPEELAIVQRWARQEGLECVEANLI